MPGKVLLEPMTGLSPQVHTEQVGGDFQGEQRGPQWTPVWGCLAAPTRPASSPLAVPQTPSTHPILPVLPFRVGGLPAILLPQPLPPHPALTSGVTPSPQPAGPHMGRRILFC